MIRKHNERDLERILEIWNQASTLAHPFLNPEFVEKVSIAMRDIYVPNSETWVFEKDNNVIGFVSMMDNEIGGLFVAPDSHSNGVGTKLVNYVSDFYDVLEVEVFEKNIIGRSFYKKYGFTLMKTFMHEESGESVMRLKK